MPRSARTPRRRAARPHAAAALAALAALAVLAGCGSEVADEERATTSGPAVTTPPPATIPTTPTAPVVTIPTTPPATVPAPTTTPGAPVTSGPDVDEARAVIQRYIDAFVAADGEAACALLTEASQQAFLAAVRDQVSASTCGEAFGQVAGQVPEDQREAFGAATISDIAVTGETATGTLTVQGISNEFSLVRVEGVWRIANLPGQ